MTRTASFAVAALAALVAAGCGHSRRHPAAPSAVPPSAPTSFVSTAPAVVVTAEVSAAPPPGTRAVHAEVRGRGDGNVGTVAVPPRYAISVMCAGRGRFRIVVDGATTSDTACHAEAETFVQVRARPPGRSAVRIAIAAPEAVRWALVVTTDPHVD